ncbi:MAG: choice-of-anchor Q domain-containing protein [Chloroflexota bacterium]
MTKPALSRRKFLHSSLLLAGSLALSAWRRSFAQAPARRVYLPLVQHGTQRLQTPVPFKDPGVEALRPLPSAPAYYVDSVHGDDDADGRSPVTAWKTLKRLHRVALGPGDVVRLARDSVWQDESLFFDHSAGRADAPIVVEAYGTGEMPTIARPRALWDNTQARSAIELTAGCHHITILDIRMIDGGSTLPAISMSLDTHHLIVAGCQIEGYGTGISVQGEYQRVLSNWIQNIGSSGGSGIGIVFCGNHLEMAWNRLIHCVAPSDAYGQDGAAFEFYNYRKDLGYDFISDDIAIHHNLIDRCLVFMEAYGNATNMLIAYNVYVNSPNHVLLFHFDDSEHDTWTHVCSYDVRIENNTFVPLQEAEPTGWGILGLLVDWVPEHNPDPAKNRMVVRNNIFVTNYRIVAFKNVLGDSLVHDHNLYHFFGDGKLSNDADGFTLAPTEIRFDASHPGDPGFFDFANLDLRLQTGSPAVDKGAPAAYPTDVMGTPTPSGDGVDMGAYELASVAPESRRAKPVF